MIKGLIIFKAIILFLAFIYFFHLFFILIYYIWATKAIKILYIISLIFLSLYYIIIIFFEIPFKNNVIKRYKKKLSKIKYILIFIFSYYILYFMEILVIGINMSKYYEYWKNCPFTITDPYENLHHKRRCELYNINNNSRFQYQYICSYDPTEDFKYEYERNSINGNTFKKIKRLKKEIEPNYIFCIMSKSSIMNNTIVNLFNFEYKNNNNYYCSRTNKPEKYSFAGDKDCNNKKQKNMLYTLFYISFFQIIFIVLYLLYLLRKNLKYLNNDIDGIRNYNFNNISINTTKESENNGRNSNFIKTITQNIIFENKTEIPIDINIKKFDLDNKNKIQIPIENDDKQTNFDIISEEVIIKNSINIINDK